MKHLKHWMITMAVLLCCVSASAYDFYDFEVKEIYYKITSEEDMTVAVTFRDLYSSGYSGSVIIPSDVTFEGKTYRVTSINGWAFERSEITSIFIPESVTSIGEWAFDECIDLTSVNIPKSVTSIGVYAFYGCGGLTSIIVEEGNTVYDSRNNCNALIETKSDSLIVGSSSTIIPEGVVSIGYRAFLNCSGLTSVTIPESVTSIDGGAFQGCSNLTSVILPNGLTSIEESVFSNCI